MSAAVLLDDTFTAAVTPTPLTAVEELLRDHYGVSATVERLSSERDEIFRVTARDGTPLICKITNPAEDPAVTDLQTAALLHIAALGPDLPVSRVHPCLDGAFGPRVRVSDGSWRTLRLLSYLPGRTLASVPSSVGLRRSIGDTLARLGTTLAKFLHPAADRVLAWDVRHAGSFDPAALAAGGERWRMPRAVLLRFAAEVSPRLEAQRRQVVHNDFNAHNLLVSDNGRDGISGILDFGDMVETQVVNDVAIAACYQLQAGGPPLAGALDVIAAYHARRPLSAAEVDLLPDLMAARLALGIVIPEGRAAQHTEKSAYILKNTKTAWAGLEHLASLDRTEAAAILRTACLTE